MKKRKGISKKIRFEVFKRDSVEIAFKKIGGICIVKQRDAKNPNLKDIYYIMGILRNRLSYFCDYKAMSLLQGAIDNGISIDTLKSFACNVNNWTDFQSDIFEL